MESGASKQLDPLILTAWHRTYARRLHAFVFGVLKDSSLAEEAVQSTFTKAFTSGGGVQPGSEKAWLFQVAYREALMILRTSKVKKRTLEQFRLDGIAELAGLNQPLMQLLQEEQVQAIKEALQRLPENYKIIVEKRIYEDKTFQQIADELLLPLGTVLTRMRTALVQLRSALR